MSEMSEMIEIKYGLSYVDDVREALRDMSPA